MPRPAQILLLAVLLALAAFPLVGEKFYIQFVTKVMIMALFAMSLDLLVGYAGLVSLGHALPFGLAAYALMLMTPEYQAPGFWLSIAASMSVAAIASLVVGLLVLRTSGIYFIMVTLAFAQMAYYVVHDTPLGGGSDGIYLYMKPALGTLLDLDRPLVLYGFTLACLGGVFGFLAVLLRSPFGRALAGIRVNEQRMRAAGYSTYPYKLAAFTLSGGIAGLAGFLFAVKDGFVNPELLSWHLSGAVLIMIILGGLGHLRGALVGAFAFALLQEFFKSEAVFGSFAKHWLLGMGLAIIVCVALLPRGLIGVADWLKARRAPQPVRAT